MSKIVQHALHPPTPATLQEGYAALAGQAFASSEQSIDYLLALACDCFGMRSSFLLRYNLSDLSLDVAHVHDRDGGCQVPRDARLYLRHDPSAWARWLQEQSQAVQRLPITVPVAGYACWASIRLASGEIFGIFVVADPTNGPFTAAESALLRVMACRIAGEIDHERERRHQMARQHQFVSIVSHEFRTALTSILGFSHLLRTNTYTTLEVQEFAGDISSDAGRILRLITDMLDFDRMASGRVTLNYQPVQLNQIIAQVAARFTLTHPIQLELAPALPTIQSDADKLVQIITNLLSNAIKYSPNGGAITIGTAAEPDHIHCWVRDHGIGIPAAALETIFDAYTRVDGPAQRTIQGTGLGLPIVRQIARLHGGHAWAESSGDQGSTFHVTLAMTQPA
jgi:signal transduction histidine kinase